MDDDMLSTLPDAVLITILSFLEAKQVAQTCVLSKRWRNLWTKLPSLDFGDEYIPCGEYQRKYENFVHTCLSLRDETIDVHYLRIRYKIAPCTMKWIFCAVNQKPKKIHIKLEGRGPIKLPKSLFTCISLEHLYLHIVENIEDTIIPDKVFLPKLKELELEGPHLEAECIDRIIFGCPDLQSLNLSYCNLITKSISFKTLKQLCFEDSFFYNPLNSSFSISAPCLEYLEFSGYIGGSIKLKDMSKVTEAKIGPSYKCELLSTLSSVKKLEINASSSSFKETLQGEISTCPTFHELKYIKIGNPCIHCDYGLLCVFLKHCPHLEHLTLVHKLDPDHHCQSKNFEGAERFACPRLRSIDVEYNSHYDFGVSRVVQFLEQSTSHIDHVQILLKETGVYY